MGLKLEETPTDVCTRHNVFIRSRTRGGPEGDEVSLCGGGVTEVFSVRPSLSSRGKRSEEGV